MTWLTQNMRICFYCKTVASLGTLTNTEHHHRVVASRVRRLADLTVNSPHFQWQMFGREMPIALEACVSHVRDYFYWSSECWRTIWAFSSRALSFVVFQEVNACSCYRLKWRLRPYGGVGWVSNTDYISHSWRTRSGVGGVLEGRMSCHKIKRHRLGFSPPENHYGCLELFNSASIKPCILVVFHQCFEHRQLLL